MTTSKHGASECFVYITLPGATQSVTAGKFVLDIDERGLARGRFTYGRSYLERQDTVELDPVELKLKTGTYRTNALKGVFGALRDAGPDYWGRRVIEKHTGKPQLGELDYLLHSPDDRAGALGFGLNAEPPAPKREFNKTLDLALLQATAQKIIDDEERPDGVETEQINELLKVGTSMGGARPKTVVEDDEGLWLAKFNHPHDRWNFARVEHATLVLARACGLQTANSKVVDVAGTDILLVKRFDREKTDAGYARARMVSGLTLLRAEDTVNSRDKWSYVLLAEELRRASAEPKKDAAELFQRMCFNALVSNTDDHPRNHALIARNRDWRLSPAYDITPTSPVSIERRDLALICGDNGRYAHADNLLSQSARFLLKDEEAAQLIAQMEQTIAASWYRIARQEGVSEQDCKAISGAFVYPGFRLKLSQTGR